MSLLGCDSLIALPLHVNECLLQYEVLKKVEERKGVNVFENNKACKWQDL
jgi:hypothetical protein